MDQPLDLDLQLFRTRGRAPKLIEASVVRPLEPADLVALSAEKGSEAPPLKRISERHHSLAKLIADGYAPGIAGTIAGYSNSRVSILQADPQFKELVAFYRQEVDAIRRDQHTLLSQVSIDALEIMQDRLEEEPEKLTFGQLMEAAKLGSDRTGFGPQSSSTNVNVHVDMASRLQLARERVQARRLENAPGERLIEGDDTEKHRAANS